jgi:hypothetical protein
MPNNLPVKQHQQKLTFAVSNNHSMPYVSAFMMKNFSGKKKFRRQDMESSRKTLLAVPSITGMAGPTPADHRIK